MVASPRLYLPLWCHGRKDKAAAGGNASVLLAGGGVWRFSLYSGKISGKLYHYRPFARLDTPCFGRYAYQIPKPTKLCCEKVFGRWWPPLELAADGQGGGIVASTQVEFTFEGRMIL